MSKPDLTIESILKKGQDLYSLPEIYIRVSELLDNENSSAILIGDTVQTDPAIASRVLKMVNSAFYGLPQQVASISQAVALLGRFQLRQILIGSVVGTVFTQIDNPAFSMQKFWEHSIKTAIIARQLAKQRSDAGSPDVLFSAGLLHDIGRLILASKAREEFAMVTELVDIRRYDVITAELEVIGFTHAQIGAALIRQWALPEILIACAGHHHENEHSGEFATASRLVYLANRLSQYVPPIDEEEALDMLAEIANWEAANRSVEQISQACQQAEDQVFEVMDFLGMVNIEIGAD